MRLIKMLGIAIATILSALTSMAASSAVADSICHTNVSHQASCPNPLNEGELFIGINQPGAPFLLLNSIKELLVVCNSAILGKVGTNLGGHKGVTALIQELGFADCAGICNAATGINEPYLVLAVGLSLHSIIEKHASGGTPGILLTGCFGFVNCQYSLTNGSALLDFIGDSLTANNEPMTRSGHSALCPATGFWDGSYLMALDEAPYNDPLFLAAL